MRMPLASIVRWVSSFITLAYQRAKPPVSALRCRRAHRAQFCLQFRPEVRLRLRGVDVFAPLALSDCRFGFFEGVPQRTSLRQCVPIKRLAKVSQIAVVRTAK